MLPAAAPHGGDYVENKAKVRHVSTPTAALRRDGADGLETVFTGD